MNFAAGRTRTSNLTEAPAVHIRVRSAEVWMVECVESLGPIFEPHSLPELRQRKFLEHGKVRNVDSGGSQVGKRPRSGPQRNGECQADSAAGSRRWEGSVRSPGPIQAADRWRIARWQWFSTLQSARLTRGSSCVRGTDLGQSGCPKRS